MSNIKTVMLMGMVFLGNSLGYIENTSAETSSNGRDHRKNILDMRWNGQEKPYGTSEKKELPQRLFKRDRW